jgi:Tfp pilus assembly PilM family ATPase
MYTSTIEIGGGDISKALQATLGDLPESEFTVLKNTKGLVPQKESPEVALIMQHTIDSIIKEVQLRIEYWHSKNSHEDDRFIESVILWGGSVNMKGIQRYVADALKIDTYRADVWRNVMSVEDAVPPIQQRYAYGYATAIGLALSQYHM